MRDDLAHAGSRERLLGAGFDAADIAAYSPEQHVDRGTPPTFLLHAADDESVAVGNSLILYAALREAGVSAELHVFAEGGHGFGLRHAAGKPVAAWPELLHAWIRALPEKPLSVR
jgi:dipeptidyl aminopeptidase/acylaminoacyl peptidase